MDRTLVYPFQIPLETDVLNANRDTMIAIGGILQMLVGSRTVVVGLAATPVSPAGMGVTIAPGSITQAGEVDPVNAYSTLGTNTNACMKMGMLYAPVTLTVSAPTTAGYSQNYLIQVEFSETDGSPEVLPYINPDNVDEALAGSGGNQIPQNTRRAQAAVLSLVAGAPAATGSQTTPAASAGCSPLYVVTVANGQTSIVSGNISVAPQAPFLNVTLPNIPIKFNTLNLYMSPTGSDSNTGLSASSPLLTFQGVVNVLVTNYELTGGSVNVFLAAGTYAGYDWNGIVTPCYIYLHGAGSGTTNLIGTGGAFEAPNPNAVGAHNSISVVISGMTLSATGTGGDYTTQGTCISVDSNATVVIGADVVFSTSQFAHIFVARNGNVGLVALGSNSGEGYTISGGAEYHIYSQIFGDITVADAPITFVGTPNFSQCFINVDPSGYVGWWGNTVTGSCTGVKYNVDVNSCLNTSGVGGSSIPGSIAGNVASSGYVI